MAELLVLGCSNRKAETSDVTPALHLYDGPFYQDFRAYLRKWRWPDRLDVAVLSAEFGFIGALTEIGNYDRRMTRTRAEELAPRLAGQVHSWLDQYNKISLCLGKDYLAALPPEALDHTQKTEVLEGSIGIKRQKLGRLLHERASKRRASCAPRPPERLSYFLPDWDDLIDPEFDFTNDRFSGPRGERHDSHCAHLMQPHPIADGILVSLAQKRATKGPLRYVGGLQPSTLRPLDLRTHYGLKDSQSLFGDCGAFSYVHEAAPPFSADYAVSLYELYNFDYGTAVDHIPVPYIKTAKGRRQLSQRKRKERVHLTIQNADEFIAQAKRRRAGFIPVGTVQGLSPRDYAHNACLYADLGYERIALGGLVPLPDPLVHDIVSVTMEALKARKGAVPDVHLFGIFRPQLQVAFRKLGVASFDSATYFRKAWLRSGQNYLAHNGEWYAAIRVPMTRDGRTRNKLIKAGHDLARMEALEATALAALHDYDAGKVPMETALVAVTAYDIHLERSSEDKALLAAQYARTLQDRPWDHCPCPVCQKTGIDVLIFRGSNRNKRRGVHNTWRLYQTVCGQGQ